MRGRWYCTFLTYRLETREEVVTVIDHSWLLLLLYDLDRPVALLENFALGTSYGGQTVHEPLSVGYLARSVHWNGVEESVEPDFVITNELVALL